VLGIFYNIFFSNINLQYIDHLIVPCYFFLRLQKYNRIHLLLPFMLINKQGSFRVSILKQFRPDRAKNQFQNFFILNFFF